MTRSAAGNPPAAALDGIRVLELASLYAAPLIGMNLADFGAEVIKVEHPHGDDARRWGLSSGNVPLWWKSIARNKQLVALDLNVPQDRAVVRKLAAEADVLIENFRPGRLENWELGYDELSRTNPGLVMVRVTGFGQTGPYCDRPGFGTLAEAFSGFAHVTGEPTGPPTLPPFGLADGVAGLAGTFATLAALYWRDAQGGKLGQVIDLSLYEPLFSILGPQITEYAALDVVQNRMGNRSPRTVPRNAYETADGGWVAISAGTQQIAERIFRIIGRQDMVADSRFSDAAGRRRHADEIDNAVAAWIRTRSLTEVLREFERGQAPAAPVMDAALIAADGHYQARQSFITLPDPDLGEVTVVNIAPRLSRTPGVVRHPGKLAVGADSDAVLRAVDGDLNKVEQPPGRSRPPARDSEGG